MKKLILISALLFSFNGWAEGCVYGDCVNGYGEYLYENLAKYRGQFKEAKHHGDGTFIWKDGSKYVGEFRNNRIDGKGKLTKINGDSYEGEWRNNKYHGKGILISRKEIKNRPGKTYLATEDGIFESGKFLGTPKRKWLGNYDGLIVCFNSDSKIYDLDNLNITNDDSLMGYIEYQTKDFFGTVREHNLVWNPETSTSCNITLNTKRYICVVEDKETDIKYCQK